MLLYAIRHAESLSNVHSDAGLNSDLSSLGRRQAMALAKRFGGIAIQAIYCSPYHRCLATAIPLADDLKLPIRIRPDLCEHHHLPLSATCELIVPNIEEITRQVPQTLKCPNYTGSFDWVPPDETLPQLVDRMQALSNDLKSRWSGEDDTVIVIAHGSPIARLIEAWLTDQPGPSFRFIIDNAAVTALRNHQGVSSLVCLNEVSHLTGLPAPQSANYRRDGSIKPRPTSNYW